MRAFKFKGRTFKAEPVPIDVCRGCCGLNSLLCMQLPPCSGIIYVETTTKPKRVWLFIITMLIEFIKSIIKSIKRTIKRTIKLIF